MDDLLPARAILPQFDYDRRTETAYCPWACPYSSQLSVFLPDQWSWPVEPDLLAYCERVSFDSTIEAVVPMASHTC